MNRREEFIQGLRDLASFLESNDSLPVPYCYTVGAFVEDGQPFKEAARSIGAARKIFDDTYMSLNRTFGPVSYEVSIRREKVCERRVVGYEDVPARRREIVEWECKDSLLGGAE